MCEDDDCTDDAEVKITYQQGTPLLEKEELLCDVHGAARLKALLADPTVRDPKSEDYDEDAEFDEDEDEDEEDEDDDGEESA